MKIKFLLLVLLVFVFALGSCESKKEEQKAAPQVSKETPKPKPVEAAPSDALAKVGDRYIRVADYEKQLGKLSPKLAESEHGRKYVVNQYVENVLIEKEAEARGLTKNPAIAAKIEDFTRSLYRNSLLQALKEGQKPVSDEEAKKYFQEHEEEFIQPDRVRLSLIEMDLDKEKEINAIQKDLKGRQGFRPTGHGSQQTCERQTGWGHRFRHPEAVQGFDRRGLHHEAGRDFQAFQDPQRVDHHQGDGVREEAGDPRGRRDQASTGAAGGDGNIKVL